MSASCLVVLNINNVRYALHLKNDALLAVFNVGTQPKYRPLSFQFCADVHAPNGRLKNREAALAAAKKTVASRLAHLLGRPAQRL
jgi:hypothetical protein